MQYALTDSCSYLSTIVKARGSLVLCETNQLIVSLSAQTIVSKLKDIARML